jgi:hypothetical protein
MRTDGQTDMAKLTVAFRNFANAPNNGIKLEGSRRGEVPGRSGHLSRGTWENHEKNSIKNIRYPDRDQKP